MIRYPSQRNLEAKTFDSLMRGNDAMNLFLYETEDVKMIARF